MKNEKNEVIKKHAWLSYGVLIIVGSLTVSLLVEAWTSPTVAPPDGNVATPINVGANEQTKTGKFIANGLESSGGIIANLKVSAPSFEDKNDANYYVDPASTSYMNDLRSNIMYDRNDTNYYVDPASTSKFNTINLGGVARSSWPSVPVETDPTVTASVKDGVGWGEIGGRPKTVNSYCYAKTRNIGDWGADCCGYDEVLLSVGCDAKAPPFIFQRVGPELAMSVTNEGDACGVCGGHGGHKTLWLVCCYWK